jgi:hypothetical protein
MDKEAIYLEVRTEMIEDLLEEGLMIFVDENYPVYVRREADELIRLFTQRQFRSKF